MCAADSGIAHQVLTGVMRNCCAAPCYANCMRLLAPAWIALALTTGCLRFGYAADPGLLDAGFDSGMVGSDAAVSDAGPAAGSGAGFDGGIDAATNGVDANLVAGNGASDASEPLDAGLLDSGVSDTSDSGAADAGISDSGLDAQTDPGTDSGMVDAGAPDPGTTDPVAAIWTRDCPNMPGVLFCDDFEGGLVKWDYTVNTRGSTAVSPDYKRGGSYSLRASSSASTTNQQSKARRGVKVFGHRKSGNLWARYYYYLPSGINLTDKFSTGVISEYEDPWLGFSVLIFPDGIGLESRDTSRKISTTFPRDQWVCVEMHVLVHATTGVFEFFMNGDPVIGLSGINTVPAMGYTSFEAGVHYANFGQGAITSYTDDVKLGTTRLGCD